MEKNGANLKKLNACVEISHYPLQKTPCYDCFQFKELINKQSQMISEIMANQNSLKEQFSKLQATSEHQGKIIVEMLADNKIQLQTLNKTRQNINRLTNVFPIKTEEDLLNVEGEINELNEEKYISAVKYLIDGNLSKNFERILSREICLLYNTDGICGKKSLKGYTKIFNVIIAAVCNYSSNAEKEVRTAFQVVKKRHFRLKSSKKKE